MSTLLGHKNAGIKYIFTYCKLLYRSMFKDSTHVNVEHITLEMSVTANWKKVLEY